MTTEEYLSARQKKNWKFNSIVNKDAFLDVCRIHPLKQKMVSDIVAAARQDAAVRKLIVFGSSTRYDCHPASDLDICIAWNQPCYDSSGVLLPFTGNMRKVISGVTGGRADVVNYDTLGDTVLQAAVQEGVTVYEHDI